MGRFSRLLAREGGMAPTGRLRPSATALSLAVLMAGSGIAHFVVPAPYEQIVPRFLGPAGLWVRVTGGAALASAALLARSRTRRAGGWLAAGLLIAMFPTNVQMALDGGLPGRTFPLGSPVVAWLRLPLQVPLVAWAVGVAARDPGPRNPPGGRAGRRLPTERG